MFNKYSLVRPLLYLLYFHSSDILLNIFAKLMILSVQQSKAKDIQFTITNKNN